MKKISLIVVLVLSLLIVSVVPAFALDTHQNLRADFYMWADRNYPDATGYAVLNWVKGQGVWNVTGEVWNARPDTYTLSVGTGGTCTGNVELVNFTVGSSGYGYFHAKVSSLPDEINIARIYKAGNACITELTATESEGNLVGRGHGRYLKGG